MTKVIEVRDLSKLYRLGEIGTGTISRDINQWWAKMRGKDDPYKKIGERNDRTSIGNSEYVWSLKDINFDVHQGDVLGIIGKNGAGKSTLLKILSRITAPTTGHIRTKGRIASLLEVGTGFHPDLTGRENIYLNGAIMGMRKAEVKKKFDDIVEFSGVARYIDTPVKRYSSGMYVRLAFAVAAHLEPEILIVDEVLAVGDAEFQKKCLGKMKDVTEKEGRTVLFVSHNMAAVKQLCTKGIVLRNGQLMFTGSELEAVNFYQKSGDLESSFIHTGNIEAAPGNDNIRVLSFKVEPINGDVISISSGISFELEFYLGAAGLNVDTTFELKNSDELVLFHHGCLLTGGLKSSKKGIYTVKGVIPPSLLNAGTYRFNIIFGENQKYVLYKIDEIVQFEILNENIGSNANILPGIIRPSIEYEVSHSLLTSI